MKKLLIIGASILQLPAIKKAKETGIEIPAADKASEIAGKTIVKELYVKGRLVNIVVR